MFNKMPNVCPVNKYIGEAFFSIQYAQSDFSDSLFFWTLMKMIFIKNKMPLKNF